MVSLIGVVSLLSSLRLKYKESNLPVGIRAKAWRKLMWFYEIRGTGNRVVKRDGQFATEAEAIAAGNAYLTNNKASVLRERRPD